MKNINEFPVRNLNSKERKEIAEQVQNHIKELDKQMYHMTDIDGVVFPQKISPYTELMKIKSQALDTLAKLEESGKDE